MNLHLYNAVVERRKQVSSRDKFTKVKIAEDYNNGECNICNIHYDSYKHHVCAAEHVRALHAMMLAECDMGY